MHVTWWMPSSLTPAAYFTRSRERSAHRRAPMTKRMVKRALLLVAAVAAVAAVLAFTVSPISPQTAWAALTAAAIKEGPNTPAPHSGKKALRILHADVMKLAHDYAHKRYRAVCSDLTKKERNHLGGTSKCMLAIAVLNAFVPIKKFTITAAEAREDPRARHGLRLRQREPEARRPRRRAVGRRFVPPRPPERLAPQVLARVAEEPGRRPGRRGTKRARTATHTEPVPP